MYAVSSLHIVQLAIETMLSLSELYHDTFTNQKKYNFLCRRFLIKKRASDKLNMHTYYLCLLYCPYNFYFMSTVDNLKGAFLSLYPDVFTTHLLFNAHKRNQLTGLLQQVFLK